MLDCVQESFVPESSYLKPSRLRLLGSIRIVTSSYNASSPSGDTGHTGDTSWAHSPTHTRGGNNGCSARVCHARERLGKVSRYNNRTGAHIHLLLLEKCRLLVADIGTPPVHTWASSEPPVDVALMVKNEAGISTQPSSDSCSSHRHLSVTAPEQTEDWPFYGSCHDS
jgi:hypothetical protein